MQALVLTRYDHFQIQQWPMPEIGPDEVLVKVEACGICGSDVHGMDGSTGRRQPPLIMGHEAAGTIVALGRDVQGWSAGDRVTCDSTLYCGQCWYCRRGQINLCDRRSVLGVACDEFRRHGALAEFVAVPQRVLYRLPENLTCTRAALVEPLSIALHAVHRSRIALGDTAVVIGAGMIGLLAVQALRLAGCGRILAVDLAQSRLDRACALGADQGLRADLLDVRAEVLRQTAGRGADLAIEAVGIGPTLKQAVSCLRKGGRLTLVGNLAPAAELPLQAVVTREITLAGSCGSCGEYPVCLDLLARGTIRVDPLISATAPLADGNAWFQRLAGGNEDLLKVILIP
ncbi:MAG: galactitol-1-phosphate 5-dehydrogenase [Thermoguttaceae bacterium]